MQRRDVSPLGAALGAAILAIAIGCGPGPAAPPPEPAAPPPDALSSGPARTIVYEIQALEKLLSYTPKDASDRPATLRHLAEAYVELEVVYEQNGRTSEAHVARRKAIHYYEEILAKYPQWCMQPASKKPAAQGANDAASQSPSGEAKSTHCADEVLCYLADERERDGDPAGAREGYLKLLAEYPQSDLVAHAHFGLGRTYLDEGDKDPTKLPLAEQSFLEAIKVAPPDKALAGFAQIQLGRTRAKNGDKAQAAEAFKAALTWAKAHPSVSLADEVTAEAKKELTKLDAH